MRNQFDAGAHKGHIFKVLFDGLRRAGPHTGTLDVEADEILLGITLRQADGIFALAATQLDDDGIVVVEIVCVPLAPQRETVGLQLFEGILENIFIAFHVVELHQFVLFCHKFYENVVQNY